MALKVKAKEQYQNIGKYAGTFRYVMMPELYTALAQDKVIKEAALRSGVRAHPDFSVAAPLTAIATHREWSATTYPKILHTR